MILLTVDSCLLFFITFFAGIAAEKCLNKFFAVYLVTNFLETFLLGLSATCIYFNLVSFVVPVNYMVLLPLLLPGVIILIKKPGRQSFFNRLKRVTQIFFSKKNLPFTICSGLLLFIYWIIPPQVWDSGDYHYITIRWYEQFKVIPGLANVHGRFAFNPANFIISAAYSFTDVLNQSLYPLNGVLTLLFYTWIYKKALEQAGSVFSFILFILAFLLFRVVLVTISSPSADLLSCLLLFYCGFRTYELINTGKNALDDYLPVLILCCFSVLAKLTAIPSLLLFPFIYFVLIKINKNNFTLVKLAFIAGLIFIPWLARNFLLSGYFLFPIPGTNIFHPDWSVPDSVMQLEYLFAKYGPRAEQSKFNYIILQKMNLLQITEAWFTYISRSFPLGAKIFLVAAFSPFGWGLVYILTGKVNKNQFFLWIVYYVCVGAWLINSPEFRFGLSYMLLASALPVLGLLSGMPSKERFYPIFFLILTCMLPLYYSFIAINKRNKNGLSLRHCWIRPAKDIRYSYKNDSSTFPFVNLGHGINLYLPDKTHECLNANGPCMLYRYGQIELRGDNITDGFRNVKDEVQKNYPYLNNTR